MRIVFEQVLQMSLAGSWVILFVLAARLLLRKAPKRFSYALWALVLLRLLCPVSLESPVSLMPAHEEPSLEISVPHEDISPTAPAAYHAVGGAANNTPETNPPHTENAADPLSFAMRRGVGTRALRAAWLPGLAVLLIANVISMLRLRRRLTGAARLRENIWVADHIDTAFVLGVIRPRIYLPSALSPKEQDYILLHEQTHIRRLDPLWKLLGFAALCVHWFNPLVWVAFRYAERDMELSCDEAVLARMGAEIKCDYAASLLRLASGERHFAAPLAFGEGGTKQRIQNVLHYRKPAFWVIAVCMIAVIGLAVGLLTDPVRSAPAAASPSELAGVSYRVEEVTYITPIFSIDIAPEDAPRYRLGSALYEIMESPGLSAGTAAYCGELVPSTLSQEEFTALFYAADVFEQLPELWQNNASLWQCAQQDSFYLLFLQKDGSIYLGRGKENAKRSAEETGPVISWIFKLAEDGPVPLSSADFVGNYEVAEILYEDGVYNFGYTLDTAPCYSITQYNFLWEFETHVQLSETGMSGGSLVKTELTEENFDNLFRETNLATNKNPAELRQSCAQAWEVLSRDDGRLYLLLAQEDGTLLVAHGYQATADAPASIRWLFRLERRMLSPADLAGDYQVAEIAFSDGKYSFTYSLENAPLFRITDDNAVWEMHPNTIPSETRLKGGYLEETELTAENFDELFLQNLAEELREHCLQAWVANAIDGECRYWLLAQEDGSLYLASGYQGTTDIPAGIRWLFRLEHTNTQSKENKESEVSSKLIEAIGESEEYDAYYTELLSCKFSGYAEQTVEAFNASIAPTPKRLADLLEYYAYVSAAIAKDDPEYDFLTVTLNTSLTELYNEALDDEYVFHFYLRADGDPVKPLNSEEALLLENNPQYEFLFTAAVWVDYESDDPALTIGERDEVLRGLQNGLQEYVNSLPRTALSDTSVRDLLTRRAQEITQSYPQAADMNVRVSFDDMYYIE